MGGIQSSIPPLDRSQPYFALFFQKYDKIKIILADTATIEIIRSACVTVDPGCIQGSYLEEDGSYHIKFRGTPFSSASNFSMAVFAKTIAMNILAHLYAAGWDFLLSSDLSRYDDLTTWFFQRVTNTPREIPRICCLSLSSTDTLQFIGADSSDASWMNDLLKYAVHKSYGSGIQDERMRETCYELKLRGTPWLTSSLELGVEARKMLLEIIRQFHARSYRLYATADLKGTADCLFFTYHQPLVDTTQERFCMISLNANDRLRLIDCPPVVIDAARQLIASRGSWPAGLQNEYDLGSSSEGYTWEFQMRGYPWSADGSDAVFSRLFFIDLFNALLQLGWCLHTSLDIRRRINDKAVFILRSCQSMQLPHFCISLNETDKVRLINSNQGPGQDATMMQNILRRAIQASWPPDIRREDVYYDSYEFKLGGILIF